MPSHFLGIYVVLYDYTPQSEQELSLKEGDLLYVLEKSEDDDWWKAKKRTLFTDEDEPEGLVPCNYIEEAKTIGKAKATYDYTRQTQEELSFTEDAILDVYDTQDPDWTLVGYNGEYGFAPANYIEIDEQGEEASPAPAPVPAPVPVAARPPPALTLPPRSHSPSPPLPPSPGIAPPDLEKPLPTPQPDYDDQPPPPTPPRPVSMVGASSNNRISMPPGRPQQGPPSANNSRSPRMQQPSPRRARFADYPDSDSDDGPSLPVKRPPHERRAQRQQSDYGDDRLHPVEPGSPGHIPPGYRTFPVAELIGKKKHAALLALGPDRIILIPDKSTLPRQEWSIENMLNYSVEGKHVFIDCNYPTKAMDLHAGSKEGAAEIFSALGEINGAARAAGLREVLSAAENKYKRSEAIGTILWDFVAGGQDEVSVAAGDEVTILDDKDADWWLVKRTVNGEEGVVPSSYVERGRTDIAASIDGKTKEAKARNSVHGGDYARMSSSPSLPSGVQLPVRTTSLASKRQNGEVQPQKTKPDASKLRTWTDRSKTFKVEAQFLGCRDGKIHLHKSNGVKIAVPVAKMSVEDLEYVERITGLSLDEDKPLSYVKNQQGQQSHQQRLQQQKPQSGITIEKPSSGASQDKKNEYDWFDFFLGCGIDLGQCQRYALNFQKENMDETFLPELTASSMRSLGMKEGDIIRATKFLDNKYNRNGSDGGKKAVSFGSTEVIGENGGRKGRPAPAVVTSDTVDLNAFLQKPSPPPASKSPGGSPGGFEDDAWAPKPSKQVESLKPATPPVPTQPTPPPPAPAPVVHPDIAGLSLDTPPLQPTTVSPPPPQTSISSQPSFAAQARQRPAAPSSAGSATGSLIPPPPPQRPISAPQTFQPNPMGSAPLQPQMTGLPLTSTAPPGQLSMADQLHNMRMAQIQQQQESLAQTQRMILAQMTGANPLIAHATGLTQQHQQQANIPPQQPSGFMNGLPTLQQPQPQIPQQSFQPLINQPTGMMPQPTGMMGQPRMPQPTEMGMGMGMGMAGGMAGMRTPGQPITMPVNSLLQPALVPQQTGLMQPLKPQATGPPPPVRFGVQPGAPKLAPQPTGKRANLSQATPENPFGF